MEIFGDKQFLWDAFRFIIVLTWIMECEESFVAAYPHPPILSVSEYTVEVPWNSTFTVECDGAYPVEWTFPERCGNDINQRLDITYSTNKLEYHSKLTVQRTNYLDTGMYSCRYNGTEDVNSRGRGSSVYLFVHDPQNLFTVGSGCHQGTFIVAFQYIPVVINCTVTSPAVNVTLWKIGPGESGSEMVVTGEDVQYDPTVGFTISYPSFYYTDEFRCRAVLGNITQEHSVNLWFFTQPYNDPKPTIDAKHARHPVVNSTFNLTCSVDVDLTTLVFIHWKYPNKNDSRITEGNATTEDRVGAGHYKYQKVSRFLIVRNAQPSDEGTYTCSAYDHLMNSGHTSFEILIYRAKHPSHVNFTTDIDVSKPVVYEAGRDVQFVITIVAFPSMENVRLYWLHNDNPLQFSDHLQSRNTSSRVILTINRLNRTNAGVYTLCGKTAETENNISITLLVKDEPQVDVDHTWAYYQAGQQYTFLCNGVGYPEPTVWWRWKPCNNPKKCRPEITLGWQDADSAMFPPNNDKMTFDKVGKFEKVAQLQVTANQSGHYRCMASNEMGEVNVTFMFIVTDVINGFGITLQNNEPVVEDNITMTCKSNVFNYTTLKWTWKPLYGNNTWNPISENLDTTVITSSSSYSHSSTVTFNSIQLDSSGEYLCTAWNEDEPEKSNNQSINIFVKAIQKPVVNRTNMDDSLVEAKHGALVEFFCYTSGFPLPQVVWTKDNKALHVGNSTRIEITEDNQRLIIKKVTEKDSGLYKCIARNRGGVAIRNTTLQLMTGGMLALKGMTTTDISMLVVFIITGAVLLVVIVVLAKKIHKDKKRKSELDFLSHKSFNQGQLEIFNPNLPLEDQIDLLPYDQSWEFPRERLKLGRTLGQGAFGRVIKAEAIGLMDGAASTTVAVKLLKERADLNQRKALMAELKILIHLGRHLNIVNLLGAVTKNLNTGEFMVIVEYCCYGNLRHYLLRHRETFVNQLDPLTGKVNPSICNLPGSPVVIDAEEKVVAYQNVLGIGVSNPMYGEKILHYAQLFHSTQCSQTSDISSPTLFSEYDPSGGDASFPGSVNHDASDFRDAKTHVTTCDLLCYAFQCSRGMEYLASRKLLHRDLAARNVLLAKDNVVKICDFGLAKDCYKYSNYVKKGDGPLPIKWMAIESIRDRVFTIKSDIWSFGVLLWEFFTLGGNPYPGIDIDEEFYRRLKNGYRMEKPEFSPDSVHQIMEECWRAEPNQRPNFSTLTDRLGSLLESSVRKYYIELNNPYTDMNDKLLNNNDYLCMGRSEQLDYVPMEETTEESASFQDGQMTKSNPVIHYDNISSVRPIGNGPTPKEPMEVVPMIQLESISGEKYEIFKKSNSNETGKRISCNSSEISSRFGNSSNSEYLYMTSSVDAENDDDSVFLDMSSGFHSDCASSDQLAVKL